MIRHSANLVCILLLLGTQPAFAQQKMVLRSLEEIESPSFEFDRFQIVSAEGKVLHWDEVHSGSVARDEQESFDRMLDEIGTPLFQARHRVAVGDNRSLTTTASLLRNKYSSVESTEKTCRALFIASLASFFDHLGKANRELAVVDFIALSKLGSSFPEQIDSKLLPGKLPVIDIANGFTEALIPVWFDASSASTALNQIVTNHKQDWSEYSDGQLIYVASLAIRTKNSMVTDCLQELAGRSSTIAEGWAPLLLAYQEIAMDQPGQAIKSLENELGGLVGARRAVAQYLLGLATGSIEGRFDDGILQLIYIPAVFGEQSPHLAAAALFEASQLAKRAGKTAESNSLKAELKNRYPQSHHARLLRSKK